MQGAFSSLSLCVAFTGASIVLLNLVASSLPGDPDWVGRLIPWGWKYVLLSGDVTTRLVAYAAMLGFTALFLLLAFRTFHKRDL